MYNILWEFYVKPGNENAFVRHYGCDGTWAEFFRRGTGYRRTHLFRDVSNPLRYLTLDQWESEEHFQAFELKHKEEYNAIDLLCEELTDREIRLASWSGSGS